jgi:hypothetical protein
MRGLASDARHGRAAETPRIYERRLSEVKTVLARDSHDQHSPIPLRDGTLHESRDNLFTVRTSGENRDDVAGGRKEKAARG